MSLVGYARVSTVDQSLDIQIQQLKDAGCERIFQEKQSAKTIERPELHRCLEWVRDGDVLIVTRLDRVARSVPDLRNIITQLEAKQTGFRCLHQPMDTTTPEGRLMLNVLGAFAEFELDIRHERQKEGIAAAKARGAYKTPIKFNPKTCRRLRDEEGLTAFQISRKMGCSHRHVYKMVPDGWGETPKNLLRGREPKSVEPEGGDEAYLPAVTPEEVKQNKPKKMRMFGFGG